MMVPSRTLASFALAAAALAAAACSAGTSGPAKVSICPGPLTLGPQIVVPSPGATGVPTAAGTLEFRDSLQPARVAVSLVPPAGAAVALGIVQGAATPDPSGNDPLVSLPYPQLQSATMYTVTYADQGTSGSSCRLGISDGGSFTTQ